MANSSIYLVKKKILDLLLAHASLDDTNTFFGVPGNVPREGVYLGGTVDEDQEWASLGAQKRDETYTVSCVVWCNLPGKTQEQATLRASELMGYVESTLRTNYRPLISSGDLIALEIRTPHLEESGQSNSEGFAAKFEFGIRATVRI